MERIDASCNFISHTVLEIRLLKIWYYEEEEEDYDYEGKKFVPNKKGYIGMGGHILRPMLLQLPIIL